MQEPEDRLLLKLQMLLCNEFINRRRLRTAGGVGLICMAALSSPAAYAQHAYSWQELRERFEAANPTLQAAQVSVDEARAAEITAYLRPNPDFTLSQDGTQLAPYQGIWRPFSGTQVSPSISYLHERNQKRELRRDSAKQSTEIAQSTLQDQRRTLLFNLRTAFVQTLQAKAYLQLARDNLAFWDKTLAVSSDRFKSGDIAEIDLHKLELQRVQYESDIQTASVSLRTAKIQLLTLMNDRTPVEQFDVAGPFDFPARVPPLDEFRQAAVESRPDLKAAAQNVELAKVNHRLAVANGSTDPTVSVWTTHNPSFNNPFVNNTLGASVSVPLRFFDRNQGEKLRTQLDITRTGKLLGAAQAQVFSDVDSAYATLNSNLNLLRPYKAKYLQLAAQVRDTISFSYQRGGASLLFISAENDYRSVQLNYTNLVAAYLNAAGQLNLAVGREVLP